MIECFTGAAGSPATSARPRRLTHVVFDFDGTLSWLRHGWPEIMYQVLRPHFTLKAGEKETALHDLLIDDILSLNGKPSIHQMVRGVERIRERGGSAPDPQMLLTEYQTRLDAAIAGRRRTIEIGAAKADDFLIFGARKFLDNLRDRGLILVILSGTAEPNVKDEARFLGLEPYFGRHIYGSTPGADFSKREVLDRLLAEEQIEGRALLSFGDGPVEIFHTKELGGVAVAVASDEDRHGSGRIHPQKRTLLLEAGADFLIPDYRDPEAILECLFTTK
jgi:phosphoglycolate phosphatase-like HAD superfamily hydrolase